MPITPLTESDLPACVDVLIDTSNGPPWEYAWTPAKALVYLTELYRMPRRVGWVLREDSAGAAGDAAGGPVIAFALGYERTWWTADEVYIAEFNVARAHQRRGHGARLLDHVEDHCRTHGLGGVTLLTDPRMPALAFYQAQSYTHAEHVVFMYKVVGS